jgi:stringent starvation protein B
MFFSTRFNGIHEDIFITNEIQLKYLCKENGEGISLFRKYKETKINEN